MPKIKEIVEMHNTLIIYDKNLIARKKQEGGGGKKYLWELFTVI